MTSKRFHLVLIGVIILLLAGLVGSAYGINKLFGTEADHLTSLKAKSLALAQEQQGLIKAKSDIKKYAELQKITRSVVPEDKSQAEAVREIVNIAAANNIGLGSISFPASSLGNAPIGAVVKPANPGTATNTKTLSQLVPVKNIPGVYQLLITVAGDSNNPVRYDEFINFLAALEHNRRTSQVTSITLQPDTKNPNNLTFNLTITEYIKP